MQRSKKSFDGSANSTVKESLGSSKRVLHTEDPSRSTRFTVLAPSLKIPLGWGKEHFEISIPTIVRIFKGVQEILRQEEDDEEDEPNEVFSLDKERANTVPSDLNKGVPADNCFFQSSFSK